VAWLGQAACPLCLDPVQRTAAGLPEKILNKAYNAHGTFALKRVLRRYTTAAIIGNTCKVNTGMYASFIESRFADGETHSVMLVPS
jgi:hypothetical protein